MKKVIFALIGLIFVSRIWALTPVPYTEGVSFSFRLSGAGSAIMTVIDESPTAVAVNRDTTGATLESDVALAWLRPGKKYSVNISGTGASEFWLSFITPKGYVFLINDSPTSLIDQTLTGGSFSYPYSIELRPQASYEPAAFGSFSGIEIGKSVTWEIGLGALHNGRAAGRIIFKESDLSNSPVSRDRLYYIPPASSGEISVMVDISSQTLRQVYVPQGWVDIVDDAGGNGYSFNFYTPAPANTLWKTIRVELASGALKITDKEGTVSQVSLLTLTAGTTSTATGGTITTSGGYTIHKFTSTGTFTAAGNIPAEIFLIAGGGGGGNALPGTMNGGGGGAGGAVDKFIPIASDSYTVTVGAGGGANTNGADTVFFSLVAKGGGAGATGNHGPGGSGGNGGGQGNLPGGSIGFGIWGQGFNGGAGMGSWPLAGGGGGGSGAQGGTPNGGAGFSSSISGSAVSYAGGGGGGSNDPTGGTGGSGGGGAGGGSSGPNGSSGSANTGGGGGGCNTGTAGSGGSGIVIIRYPTSPSGVASGNYTWTLQEGDGSTWLRTMTHTSTTGTGYRDDLVQVRTGGTAGTVVATTRYRYHDFGWGEEIQQVTVDPTTANLTTTYDYYTAVGSPITNLGNYRQVKSVTGGDGNWSAYQYWDDWDRRAQVQREYHPYLDLPATVSFNYTVGRVIYKDYGPDWTGRFTRASVSQETVNNVLTGKTVWSQGDITGAGLPRAYASIKSYRDGSNYQTDYVDNYRSDSSPVDEANRPYVSKGANQTQTSFCDGYGSFNAGTGAFTYTSSISSGGTFFREFQVQGSTSSTGATLISSWGGQSFAPIYVIANRSTIAATIRDIAGNVVRTETWVYNSGGTFVLLNYENVTCDFAGRLTQRVASNAATVDTHYTNGRMDYSVDATGTRTDYSYDLIGRVLTTTKNAVGALGTYAAQGAIVATNTYDGNNHVTQTMTSGAALSVTGTAHYDLAGRLDQTVANVGSTNVLTTGYAYSSGGKIVTATLPGGATKITETYLDGQLKSVTGTGGVNQSITPSIDAGTGRRKTQTYTGGISANTVTNYTDWLGHAVEEDRPGWNGTAVSRIATYNNSGQLTKYTQPGMADTLFEYDTLGVQTRQGLDINANGVLDNASDDRITGQANSIYTWDSVSWWTYSGTYTYATSLSGTTTTTNQGRVCLNNAANYLDQRTSWDIYGNETLQTTVVDRPNKKVTMTTIYPDASIHSVQVTYNGLLVESTDRSNIKTTYGYDALGRTSTMTDPRTGTATTFYIGKTSLVDHVTDQAISTQATYTYDTAGRVATVTDYYGKYTRYEYNDRNQKTHEFGDNTYPVEHVYNALGQQTALNTFAKSTSVFSTTWPAAPNNVQATTWSYQPATGLLQTKTDAASHIVSYTYTQADQLLTKTSGRGVVATYGYFPKTGELNTVVYTSDPTSTPGVTYTYNRLGQLAQINDATTTVSGVRTFNYNLAGTLELQNETLPTSFFGDMRIGRGYDTTAGTVGRYNTLTAGPAASPTYSVSYGYEATTGRLNFAWVFTYNYLANSNLIQSTTQGAWGYTDTRGYNLQHDWISSRTTTLGATTKAAFAYTPDPVGRITDVIKTGEIFNRYGNGTGTDGIKTTTGYNDLSEVISENTTEGTAFSANLPGRLDGYTFDKLGNRKTTSHNSTSYTWTTNSLNQATNISGMGFFDVAGAAAATSTVSVVDPVTGTTTIGSSGRDGQYFFQKHAIDNSASSVSRTLTVNAPGSTPASMTVSAFMLMNNYTKTYDADGNLTGDGRWVFTYDAENRLISMQTRAALCPGVIANVDARKLDFKYDYMNRRVEKIVRAGYNGTSYTTVSSDTKFVYDGWNVLYELNALSSNAYVRSNVWGLDLSGTLQGAGGVGGLLGTYEYANAIWAIPMYDARGNVHGLINSGTGATMAAYEYDAFGNMLRESGTYAANNPFRFSTKYTDIETGLVYYGQRYYSSSLGRFINRDPIEESGGLNLYGFCRNNGVNGYDYLGLSEGTVILDPFIVNGIRSVFNRGALLPMMAEGNSFGGSNARGEPNDPILKHTGVHLGNENDKSLVNDFNNNKFAPGSGLNGQDSTGYGGTPVVLDPVQVTTQAPTNASGSNGAPSNGAGAAGVIGMVTTAPRYFPTTTGNPIPAITRFIQSTGAAAGDLLAAVLRGGVALIFLTPNNQRTDGAGDYIQEGLSPNFLDPILQIDARTPSTGVPGSVVTFPDGTTRIYGPDGKAVIDIDSGHDHTGAGDPHSHPWDWTKTSPRQPPRPVFPIDPVP